MEREGEGDPVAGTKKVVKRTLRFLAKASAAVGSVNVAAWSRLSGARVSQKNWHEKTGLGV